MIPIRQDILPKSRRPGHAMRPEWITVHQTGNTAAGANAAAHARWLHTVAPNPSWHFTVDDREIWQHLPLNENGWHAADGTNGPGNRRSIGIESCVNRDGNLARAEDNMAWLCAHLIREVLSLRPFPEGIRQHWHWNNTRNCPAQIRARQNGWANFLQQMEGHLKPRPTAAQPPCLTADRPACATADRREIAIFVNDNKSDATGVLIDNTTRVPASFAAELAGGTVTGYGDHIRFSVPDIAAEIEIGIARTIIADAKRLHAELGKVLNRGE